MPLDAAMVWAAVLCLRAVVGMKWNSVEVVPSQSSKEVQVEGYD